MDPETIVKKYLDRMMEVLGRTDLRDEDANKLADILCDSVMESFAAGKALTKLPNQVVKRVAPTKVTATMPDGSAMTHYFWDMEAGFMSLDEASFYYEQLKERNPDNQYGLFSDGVLLDYSDDLE